MTVELVAFPDAEALAVGYLQAELTARGDTARVSTRHPTTVKAPGPVTRFVRVTRTGGPRTNLVTDGAQLMFQCWDTDETAAAGLCTLVRALVWAMDAAMVGDVWVRRVQEFSGPVNYPDPDTDMPRYQISMNVETKGQTL